MIRLQDVAKEYTHTRIALSHVTCQIKRGEFVFLIGPSGSGKTTILKLLYMEEKPSHGEVWVNGVHANSAKRKEISQLRRKLGIVFQDFRLLEDRTAEQNVAFALEVTGAPGATIPQRVTRVLTQVGLASKGTHLPRQLSGGEQQRVAIARALVNDPYFLLADEPTGNLDERATRGVFQLLRDINAAGTSVIMATHDLEMVRRADEARTIELNHGRVVFDSAETPPPETRYTPLLGQSALGGPNEDHWPPPPGGGR
ncbi:MAG: cell division ATP-binding protein FtsE [Gemmatimonadaceae bacterium]|nr:cell division ATP-binding protein FtsE [Gemmatimonadaceae bacterium]MDQ3242310.1 cell division ATP-binding protein FtsE [Gemmatimonadota bacterium]